MRGVLRFDLLYDGMGAAGLAAGALARRVSARGTPQGAKIKLRALHDALDTALRTRRVFGARSALQATLRPTRSGGAL